MRWSDNSTSWVKLSRMKESNPIELAEYAEQAGISKEPAFLWWVNHVLRKRTTIIRKMKSRLTKRKIKFGVEIPSMYKEALILDKKNGNDLWQRAIEKEMRNVGVAFKFQDSETRPPPGYKRLPCHMIFDVKFTLERKCRYVAGGHMVDTPAHLTHSSVVARDSVRIALTYAALNDHEISVCDISNAYLNAQTQEKVFFEAGNEWGSKAGRIVVVVRALYGLKGSALAWQQHLFDNLRYNLGYEQSKADANVWMKKCIKKDGICYWSYILCYVDDLCGVHVDPHSLLNFFSLNYRMKQKPEMPKMYLGSDIGTFTHENGKCFTMGSENYLKGALRTVDNLLSHEGVQFRTGRKVPQNPFTSTSYRAELDLSEECNGSQHTIFQQLVGILRWLIELGRVNICVEVSILSRYLASPRVGHLHQTLHNFHYLRYHKRSKIALNPTPIDWQDDDCATIEDTPVFKANEMRKIYVYAVEDIPQDMPEPLGSPVQINVFADSDHAADWVTRRSQTGIIIYVGKAPITWFSKRQNCVESASFGSEFVALRIATELTKSLWYKLRMFGIPFDGPANLFCDNQSVVTNSSTPESVLKKKHNSIAYHIVRESVASSIVLVNQRTTQLICSQRPYRLTNEGLTQGRSPYNIE